MRLYAGKTALLFLALVVALGGLGVGYAAWTDSVTIEGSVETAIWDCEVTGAIAELECQGYCGETAWAFCDLTSGSCFECKRGWGRYFGYQIGGEKLVLPFVAGQTMPVGNVTVSTVGDDLIVKYEITDRDWEMTESHLYVGKNKPKKCAPGQFPFNSDFVHRYVIPVSDICPEVEVEGCGVFIAAHAVVITECEGEGSSGVVFLSEGDHEVIVWLACEQGAGEGTLRFWIHNNGTIPIIVSNISYSVDPNGDPPGIEYVLATPGIIGTQLHPCEKAPCVIDIIVNSPGSYTLTVTVHSVQWNLY